MGVNNKARRAAKQRKRARGRAQAGRPGSTWGFDATATAGPPSWVALAALEVDVTLHQISGRLLDAADARRAVQLLLRNVAPVTAAVVVGLTWDSLGGLVDEVSERGWPEEDLRELVERRVGGEHLATLEALQASGRPEATGAAAEETLASQLRVAAALTMLPLAAPGAYLPPPPAGSTPSGDGARHLARVRALLAKAESTAYDAEAEALSAKAQELISRYALERLLQEPDGSDDRRVLTRRMWLDAPYLMAKAALVDAVAQANHCRCVVSEPLGFCSVVGERPDLDAVELLTTSLLVQANRSMLRHGQQRDRSGTSRTRSFRQSFLVSFANRIGQRLREVEEAAVRDAEPGTSLLPALLDQQSRISGAFEAMFPHVVSTESRVSNGQGWAAGHVAADLAVLDVNGKLTEASQV